MKIVILTAFGVGGATVLGSVLGLIFKKVSKKFSNIVLSFAAGVMLSASIIGLIIPSVESGGKFAIIITLFGIFAGALTVSLLSSAVPYFYKLIGTDAVCDKALSRVLLFISAIAIHNLPEGIAAGVGFGTGNTEDAFLIAGSIALQNIPEGMVIIAPMLACGVSAQKAFICGLFTGLIEVVGTFLGYFAITVSAALLPFFLAYAGGTMLFVICDDMIPETHQNEKNTASSFALLFGFCLMFLI